MARSSLIPNDLYGENLKMLIFFITVQAEIIILVRNVKPNETLVLF